MHILMHFARKSEISRGSIVLFLLLVLSQFQKKFIITDKLKSINKLRDRYIITEEFE